MKTVAFLGALGLAFVLTTRAASAQEQPAKVGWIDLQRTLTETKTGKAAKDRLEAQKNDKQKQVNDRKEKLTKAAQDLEKQRVVMKPDAVAKREKELQDEYAQLQQLFMQLQQDLAKQEATLTKDIFTQAASIIESIAKRDHYTMIIEKNEGAVLWAEAKYDITDEVNKRLDAGEGKKEAPPEKPPTEKPAKGK